MATERVTSGLARFVIDSARRLSGDASQKLEEAQTLIGSQDITSAETVTADAHDLLLGSNAKLNGVLKINQEFPDRFLALLEEFGINEDPPAEIFDEPTPTVNTKDVKPEKRKKDGKKEFEPSDLTQVQVKATAARFRIVPGDDREEVSLQDTANVYYGELLEAGKPLKDVIGIIRGNFNGTINKIEWAFTLAGGEKATLPFTPEQLATLQSYSNLQAILSEISLMEGYEGMSLARLLEETATGGPIKVREKKADVPPNPDPHPIETANVTKPLTQAERHYLIGTIFRRQSEMDDKNLHEIRQLLDIEYKQLGYEAGIYEDETVQQALLAKLNHYQDLPVEARKEYIKNNMGNLGGMVMSLIGPFMSSKAQLEEFLI